MQNQLPGRQLPQMIDVREVATILKVSTRSVWRLVARGQLPQPVRIGRSARWQINQIEAWLDDLVTNPRAADGHRPRPK